ncbi:MAG: ZIP family metal transporter, partial [Clostridia bacterium]
MAALLLSLGSFASTLAGGLLALRLRAKLPWILAFTAGVLLGVVAFDVLPEAFALAHREHLDPTHTMIALVGGFLVFHAAEKFVLIHHGHEDGYAAHRHPHVGLLSAAALAGHSFMDGVGIGLGFQVSSTAGIAVAIAVIAHDFCDGLNTVSLMLINQAGESRARGMLVVDSLAPVAGAASTLLFELPPQALAAYLGFFAGFLLYIGAADILPEAHSSARPRAAAGLIGLTAL